jgi:DtxR family transcriptional regulator, Mn-dependent transcriptional regulator
MLRNIEVEQDCLKAIHLLQRKGAGEPVSTAALARRLGIPGSTASSMVRKLAEAGYVAHSPYRGVALTERGERIALETLRHQRLLETYLSERLGVPWDQVRAEADLLEHALSEALEDRLDADLGHPTVDPHGAPIPTKEGILHAPPTVPLWRAAPGSTVVVAEVEDEDAALLAHLAELGLRPGVTVEVLGKGPFDGPLVVRVAGREHALGATVADAVLATTPGAGGE